MKAATAVRWALAVLAPLALAAGVAHAQTGSDLGKPGGPVKLVVGYQPYYTQAWSGVVMRPRPACASVSACRRSVSTSPASASMST